MQWSFSDGALQWDMSEQKFCKFACYISVELASVLEVSLSSKCFTLAFDSLSSFSDKEEALAGRLLSKISCIILEQGNRPHLPNLISIGKI